MDGMDLNPGASPHHPQLTWWACVGWDTPAKVQVLHGDLSTFSASDEFADVIKPPPKREVR